jgi:putative ABC transport system permease protein
MADPRPWPLAFRLLLLAYPRPFRVLYGRDLLELYRDHGVVRLWLRVAPEMVVHGLRARWDDRRAERRPMTAAGAGGSPPAGRPTESVNVTMQSIVQDFVFGMRVLRRNPGFTLVAVLTLALGIGANTAIFSVVNGILLRPLPYPDPGRLVALSERSTSGGGFGTASPPNVEDWAERSRSMEVMGLGRDWGFILREEGGVYGVAGGLATPGLFRVFGFTPQLGRLFVDGDLPPGDNRVVVLTYTMWQNHFGGDPDIVGKTLPFTDGGRTVIGVLPAGAEVPELARVEMWMPLHFNPREERYREWRGFLAFARLQPDVEIPDARREFDAIAGELAREYPTTNADWHVEITPLHAQVVGSVRRILLVFLGAVGFVLLIGCANVANLLLARGAGRQREFAVRAALGAGRARIVRLVLSESLLLAVIGGAAGVVLAVWAVRTFVALAPSGIPRMDEVALDSPVLLFAVALSMVTSVIFGLVPSLQASQLDLSSSLKEGDQRSGMGRSTLGARGALVVSEIALAFVLLVGAGLLLQSFATLLRWDPGFDRNNLLTVWTLAPAGKYTDGFQVRALQQRAVEELQSIPSVRSVGNASAGPIFGGLDASEMLIVGRPTPPAGEQPLIQWFDIGPTYFRTLGIAIVQGRDFTSSDVQGAPYVAIINQAMVRRYWPDQDPLGGQIDLYGETRTIVGVVSDVQPFEVGTPVPPLAYIPQLQIARGATYFIIRADSDPEALIPAVRARLQALEPDMQISRFMTMDQLIARRVVRPRFNMLLLGIFAAVALALAAIGIYGVVSYSVANRTREMGIRIALGAGRRNILGTVLRHGMVPSAVGIGIGLVGALGLTRVLSGMLYGVAPTDVPTFGAVAALLVLIAGVACYVPARRATKVDPIIAVRAE